LKILISIIAYNKLNSLKRLLESLTNAMKKTSLQCDLIFCIDNGGTESIVDLARSYKWNLGQIIIHKPQYNVGLKKNVYFAMQCGLEYDATIILEDDLYVSPAFFKFTEEYLSYYAEEHKLAGISLYSNGFNETSYSNFYSLNDGSDFFFMRLPCSWGQMYTKRQLTHFFDWKKANDINEFKKVLPKNIYRWSDKSWKKELLIYMIVNDLYFVYPRNSLTTNYGDAGAHHSGSYIYQRPLITEFATHKFVNFNESIAVYDEYQELCRIPKKIRDIVGSEEVDFDIYGYKIFEKAYSPEQLVVTLYPTSNSLMTWDASQLPFENNIILNIPGNKMKLALFKDIKSSVLQKVHHRISQWLKLHYIRLDLSLLRRMLGK
jgi:glycosyltransferase involved in cell wall biosynthesis